MTHTTPDAQSQPEAGDAVLHRLSTLDRFLPVWIGVAMVGGLLVSQWLTLYTTPVVYLYLGRLQLWCAQLRHGSKRAERLEAFGNGAGEGGYAVPRHVPTRQAEEVRHP